MGYNFMKVNNIATLDEPYDYDSLMHYGPKFFSKNDRPTLLPRKKGVSNCVFSYIKRLTFITQVVTCGLTKRQEK